MFGTDFCLRSENYIADEGVRVLGECLKQNTMLTQVYLEGMSKSNRFYVAMAFSGKMQRFGTDFLSALREFHWR